MPHPGPDPVPKPLLMADAPHSLNDAQLQAVHHLGGPCLVLAGAGSGKTRVIVHKIARLLRSGIEPKNIAAITFTNKAAAEMRERAKALVGARAAKDLAVSTFHSLGVRLLRSDGTRIGLKEQFSILDSDDVMGVIRDAGGCTDNALAKRFQWTISLWKNQGLDADGAAAAATDDHERVAARVMRLYQERLQAYQAVDFDDLIGLPLKLLADFPEVRAKWQAALGHVLVDEYQDTNATQYEVLKHLVGERGRFTAVGDDDQSIYGWRGATLDNLKKLPLDYPALASMADAFFPRVFLRHGTFVPAGTITLTTYFHATPGELATQGSDFVLGTARAARFGNGHFDQSAQLWGGDTLLASTHQLVYFKDPQG